MQDVVAYLMHVDGRHLQTVLNPEMHAHSQVLSAPSVKHRAVALDQGNPRALVRAYHRRVQVLAAPSYHHRAVSTKLSAASELLDILLCNSLICFKKSELPLTYGLTFAQ